MMAPARCFRGDRPALTALRLRRIVSFLRRHQLYDTAHSLETQTGAFFDAAHFRLLVRGLRWADASSYALAFVAAGRCSREADLLVSRVLILRLMADLTARRYRAADALFLRLHAALDAHPNGDHIRRTLISMRSDRSRAARLYYLFSPMAVEFILKLVAKCPEFKAKSQLPCCASDSAYAMSLGHGLRGYKTHQKNKIGRIPADVLARSFMRKRPLVSHEMTYSDVPSAPVLEAMLATSPRLAKIVPITSTSDTDMKHSRPNDAHFPESFEQAFDSRKGTERLQTTNEFVEVAGEDILVHCSLETVRPFLFPSQPGDASAR